MGIPPRPTREPPAYQLLVPPSATKEYLAKCSRIVCFSFGQGPDLTPGATNRALAALAIMARDAIIEATGKDVPFLAQWEVGRELCAHGAEVSLQIELPGGKDYITTEEVANAFAKSQLPSSSSITAVIAHPDHAWRCCAFTSMIGYIPVWVSPSLMPAFSWENFGLDSRGYSEQSVQPHTASAEIFCECEGRLQQDLLDRVPEVAKKIARPWG